MGFRIRNAGRREALFGAALILGSIAVGEIITMLIGDGAAPRGVILMALVRGTLNALLAVAVVLVFRAMRAVTFALGGFAAIASVLATLLQVQTGWPWLLAAATGLAGAVAAAFVTDWLILRRLSGSPVLVLTVATVALGQVLTIAAVLRNIGIPAAFISEKAPLSQQPVHTPFTHHKHQIGSVLFTGDHLAAVVISLLALGLVAVWLRATRTGAALRGVADNPALAEQLGVRVPSVTGLAWMAAAALAGLWALLGTAADQSSLPVVLSGVGFGLGSLIRPLVAAALARFLYPGRAAAAAIGLSVLEQCVLWATRNTAWLDATLVLVVTVGLLLQKRSAARSLDAFTHSAAAAELPAIPAVLRSLPEIRRGRLMLSLVLGGAVLGSPLLLSSSQISVLSLGILLAIIAVSIVILSGWAGQVSLGQFALAGAGGIVEVWLTGRLGVPMLLALPLAAAAGAVAAVVIGVPALRLRGVALAVTTLTSGVAFATVVLNPNVIGFATQTTVERPRILLVDFNAQRSFYYLCLLVLVGVVLLTQRVRRSAVGAAILALRDNERAAESLGLDLMRTRLAAMVLSGALAGLGGALLVHHQHALSRDTFGATAGLTLFLITVLGGVGSVTGALLGVAYQTLVGVFVPGAAGQILASGVGVLLILLISPGGLIDLLGRAQRMWLRYVALRRRIVVDGLLRPEELGVNGRRPIAPLRTADGAVQVPRVYQLPSRLGVAGSSQRRIGR